jgi:putative transposase
LNRTEKMALELLFRQGTILRLGDSRYSVLSLDGKTSFTVSWMGKSWRCDCSDFGASQRACVHVKAVALLLRLPMIITAIMNPGLLACPSCGATQEKLRKSGIQRNKSGPTQRYVCTICGYRFNERGNFDKLKGNPALILIATDLYFKGLSTRQISNHLSEFYGTKVDHTTVYRWIIRYCRLMKKFEFELLSKLRLGEKWHIDETVVKVKGEHKYLWNVMDGKTRYLLATQLSSQRDNGTFKKIFQNVTGRVGSLPREVVTDGLGTYSKVLAKYKTIKHTTGKALKDEENNNMIERVNKTIKGRIKTMEKFASEHGASLIADGIRIYYNFVRPHMALRGLTPASVGGYKYATSNKLLSLSQTKK